MLKSLKITTHLTSLLQTTVSLSAPSTLMLSGISFGNMWMKDMLKSISVEQRNNEQTTSQKVKYLKSLQIIERVIKTGD